MCSMFKKMSTYRAYISKHNLNHENQISLLMISNRGQQSLAVKKLSALLRGVTFKKVGYFNCLNCLRSYRIKNKLESHIKVSKSTDFCSAVMLPENSKTFEIDQYRT